MSTIEMPKRSITVMTIEGNIGAGKSTILRAIERYLDSCDNKTFANRFKFIMEPVDIWENIRDVSGQTILQKFYKDQHKYAFSFQMMAYISRLSLFKKTVRENPDKDIFIVERSLCADRNIFLQMLHDDEMIEDVEAQIYHRWYDEFSMDFPVHKIIYINSSPEKCYERIHKRMRSGEERIPLDYLRRCHQYHQTWLNPNKEESENNWKIQNGNVDYLTEVLHIDANEDTNYDFKDENDIGKLWVEQILAIH